MSHPEMTGSGETPATPRIAHEPGEQERPLPSSDERIDRAQRATDVLQHARQLAAEGEMTAALTTLRALVAREP